MKEMSRSSPESDPSVVCPHHDSGPAIREPRTAVRRRRQRTASHPGTSRVTGIWKQWNHRLQQRPLTLRITDAILTALILLLPFLMGGREARGHQFLITLSLSLAFIWSIHGFCHGARLTLMRVETLFLAGLLLVWFQTVPLDAQTLHRLSSAYNRVAALPVSPSPASAESSSTINTSGDHPGSDWSTPSLCPAETRHAFWMLLSYGLVAIVLTQRISSEDDGRFFLKLVAVSGFLMSMFAVVQYLTSNDLFFWFYRHPYTGTSEVLKGAFTNRNHFAQFLSVCIGPALWWALSTERSRLPQSESVRSIGPKRESHTLVSSDRIHSLLLLMMVGTILMCVLLSLSRGGIVSAGIVCCVCVIGFWKLQRLRSSGVLILPALGMMVILGLLVVGSDGVEDRIGQLASGDADQIDRLNARRSIWRADLAAVRDFPLLGTGVGTHRFVYPLYMQDQGQFGDAIFSHAESTWINLVLETGLSGLFLLLGGLILVMVRILWPILRNDRFPSTELCVVALAGIAGGAAHACVDFVWYAPAIVVTTIVLAVVGLRSAGGYRADTGIPLPKLIWITAAGACIFGCMALQPGLESRAQGERYWYQYLNAQTDASGALLQNSDSDITPDFRSSGHTDEIEAFSASGANDFTPETDFGIKNRREDSHRNLPESLQSRIRLLLVSLRMNPEQPEASRHLAARCLELFEELQRRSDNNLPLHQIRDVVLTSKFDSTEQMYSFFRRAFGNNMRLPMMAQQFSRRSIMLCPVSGPAWESLAVTSFVLDPKDPSHDLYLRQAATLGVYSPSLRYSLGLTLLHQGRHAEAMQHWTMVFHSDAELRRKICQILSRNHSASHLLERFQPTLGELPEVLEAFRGTSRRRDLLLISGAVADRTREQLQHENHPEPPSDGESSRRSSCSIVMETYRALWAAGPGDPQLRDQCRMLLELAAACDPAAESPRRALGLLLMESREYQQAEAHFAWCSEQSPHDEHLDNLRRECRRLASGQSRLLRTVSWETESND